MQAEGAVRASYPDRRSLGPVVGTRNWGRWGLPGVGQFPEAARNPVNPVFGSTPGGERTINVVVGPAGRSELYFGYPLYSATTAPSAGGRGGDRLS